MRQSNFLLAKQKEVCSNASWLDLVLKTAELISNYLNGPRQLSQQLLSKLIISTPPYPRTNGATQFDVLLAATHFIGDGMALHTFANDFWSLVGQSCNDGNLPMNTHELREFLRDELSDRMKVSTRSYSLSQDICLTIWLTIRLKATPFLFPLKLGFNRLQLMQRRIAQCRRFYI